MRRTGNAQRYKRVDLHPGELYLAEKPTIVWTLLGSCLAVVFHNARLGISAICHAQLAEEKMHEYTCSDYCPHPCFMEAPESNRFKYVTCALRYMYEQFTRLGIISNEIHVKLFGGASMFPAHQKMKSVGEENIEVAQKMIQAFNLQLVSMNIGGTSGRTLYFYSDTGEVLLRMHKPQGEPIKP
jgi:chemotaxis protein CheD